MTAFVAYLCAACHAMVDAERTSQEVATAIWTEGHRASIPLFWRLLDRAGMGLIREDEGWTPDYSPLAGFPPGR